MHFGPNNFDIMHRTVNFLGKSVVLEFYGPIGREFGTMSGLYFHTQVLVIINDNESGWVKCWANITAYVGQTLFNGWCPYFWLPYAKEQKDVGSM